MALPGTSSGGAFTPVAHPRDRGLPNLGPTSSLKRLEFLAELPGNH